MLHVSLVRISFPQVFVCRPTIRTKFRVGLQPFLHHPGSHDITLGWYHIILECPFFWRPMLIVHPFCCSHNHQIFRIRGTIFGHDIANPDEHAGISNRKSFLWRLKISKKIHSLKLTCSRLKIGHPKRKEGFKS